MVKRDVTRFEINSLRPIDAYMRKYFYWNLAKYNNLISENARENVVCELASILSWPRCVKMRFGRIPYVAIASYDRGYIREWTHHITVTS